VTEAFFAGMANADVLAYVRELLHRSGYRVPRHTSSRLGDALILMRVSHFDLVLIRPELTSSAGTHNGFQAAYAKVPVVELGSDFPKTA
jgi:hypothetical protein